MVGRVSFTERRALDFRCCSTVCILNRDMEAPICSLKANQRRLHSSIRDALRSIRGNADEFVDLSGGHVDDNAAIKLSDTLLENTSVKVLLLQNNRIRGGGMDAINAMLMVNTTLQCVHLPFQDDYEATRPESHMVDHRLVRWRHEQQGNWHRLLHFHETDRHLIPHVNADNVLVGEEAVLALAEVLKYTPIYDLQLAKTAISERGRPRFHDSKKRQIELVQK